MSLEPTPAELEAAKLVTAKRTIEHYLYRIDGLVQRASTLADRAKLTALQDALNAMHDTIVSALPVAERIEPPPTVEIIAMLRQQVDALNAQIAELEAKE
jgi:BMFP domain-containing protein YqiC